MLQRGAIRRTTLLMGILLVLVGLVATSGPSSLVPEARAQLGGNDPQPNVLVVITDDQRVDTMRAMERTRKWLGKGGTRYKRSFSAIPLCCPARASVMTGLYAHNHDVKTNAQAKNLDHDITIQRYLQEADYRTGLVGKFFNSWPVKNNPPYFDDWAMGKIGAGQVTENYYNGDWNIGGTWMKGGRDLRKVPTYSTDFVSNRSIKFLEHSENVDDDQPWFLYAAPIAPHDPALPHAKYQTASVPEWIRSPAIFEEHRRDKPPWVRKRNLNEKRGRYIRKRQIRTLMSTDELVDSVMQWLRDHHEANNTLVFFISDNGYSWGEHGMFGKSNPYTETIRLPMYTRWPDRIDRGAVDDRLVSLVDVAPTILEAAGLSAPLTAPMDGRSLLSAEPRDHLLIEFGAPAKAYDSWASFRSTDVYYIEYYNSKGGTVYREYYDLSDDPWLMHNLLGDANSKNDPDLTQVQDQLEFDQSCAGLTCP